MSASLALIGVVMSAGCERALSIDERVERLLSATQDRAGSNAKSPNKPLLSNIGDVRRPEQTERRPNITNPRAEEIPYSAANESRDVRARLERYAEQAGVQTTPKKDGGGAADGGAPADAGASAAGGTPPGELVSLNLSQSLRQAQLTGRDFLNEEEENILAAIRVLTERHLWGPRLFNDTSVTVSGSGAGGQSTSALNVVNNLRATQRLPYGGAVEAGWVWNATEQLRERVTDRYTQASRLALSGELPLLRGAGLVAQEGLIQAERDLIYRTRTFERFRREYLVRLCNEFFAIGQAKSRIANTEKQMESFRTLERSTAARVAAGRLEAFELNLTKNQVLSAEASLASQREAFILQVERYKILLGLPLEARLEIREIDLDLPDPSIDIEEATRVALDYRLDLQNTRDQLDDARRGVRNARNQLLPDLNLNASVGVPTDPAKRNGGLDFSTSDLDYSAGATLSLPLDRETERLALRSAVIGLQRRQRSYEQDRDNIIVRVRSALRNVDLARFQLQLAEQQVEINRKRLEGQRLKIDTVTPQTLVDSLNELLAAENNRDQAKTDLRNAILNYLLESDQLRVRRDGTFEPLPGMEPGMPTGDGNPERPSPPQPPSP